MINCAYTQDVPSLIAADDDDIIGHLDCPGKDNMAKCFKTRSEIALDTTCDGGVEAFNFFYCTWLDSTPPGPPPTPSPSCNSDSGTPFSSDLANPVISGFCGTGQMNEGQEQGSQLLVQAEVDFITGDPSCLGTSFDFSDPVNQQICKNNLGAILNSCNSNNDDNPKIGGSVTTNCLKWQLFGVKE
ncbi:hypothetical protein F5884DRAFT_252455 [Xylogone sp. PMI_703]|nr:hypothetical protein F5884DRAFT_252455 [Xylogone sp. PMI_703]